MVAALGNARLQDMPLVAQTLFAAAQRQAQRGQISTAAVAQLDALEVVPPPFDRIALGRRAGQLLQMEALGRTAGAVVLDRLAAMNGRPVPDDEQLAMDFAQQHAQEAHDIRAAIGLVLRLQEQPSLGREPPHRRQVVVRQRHAQDGRVPTRRPGAHGHRQQGEAGLIYPDDGASFGGRFFSEAGHRSCHQAAIAAASRWVARVTGRCTLWCTACSSRLTCAGWDVTPKVRRSTSATRLQVQTWPRKPYASAPRSRSAGIWASCSALSLGCGPGAGWRRNASTPSSRARLSHWLTAPGVTPSAAAMADGFQPCSLSSQARRRRPSRQSSWVVFVLMPPAYHTFTALYKRQ